MKQRRIPKYRLHKASGQAIVEVGGKVAYLGPYDSPKSREKYHRIVAELQRDPDPAVAIKTLRDQRKLSLNELLLAYWQFAQGYYRKPDGGPAKEQEKMWGVIERLMDRHGPMDAAEFGPIALKEVRAKMVQDDLARKYVNGQVGRIRRIFKWAVEEELVPATIPEALKAVAPLKAGRTEARETARIMPVDEAVARQVLPFLSPPVRGMVELQLLTGMRSDNVTSMRACDLDMTGPEWTYTPLHHKTEHHGHILKIPLGPKAQAVLKEFMALRLPSSDGYLFRPDAAAEWRGVERRKKRESPMTPSQAKRKPKRHPKKAPGERYDTATYRRAITYGLGQLAKSQGHELPKDRPVTSKWLKSVGAIYWHPHQLRHTLGTAVRKQFGFEAAQIALGHASPDATKLYAEADFEMAKRIARELG
ncbi:MAG TPA: hypothetical protein VMV69_22200 [Pirellulales bacterium]|nr:hypothetical protein [Pirellulales bacterium]